MKPPSKELQEARAKLTPEARAKVTAAVKQAMELMVCAKEELSQGVTPRAMQYLSGSASGDSTK